MQLVGSLMLINTLHFYAEHLINASEAMIMICYESIMDLVAIQELGISMAKNELLNKIEVLPNFHVKIIPNKICGTVVTEDLDIGMTQNKFINNIEVLPSFFTKSGSNKSNSASMIIKEDFGVGMTKNELINTRGVAESRPEAVLGANARQ